MSKQLLNHVLMSELTHTHALADREAQIVIELAAFIEGALSVEKHPTDFAKIKLALGEYLKRDNE